MDEPKSGPDEERLRRVFLRRQYVCRAASGIWALVALARMTGAEAGAALSWVASLGQWWPFAVVAAFIWAFRCPACKAGIKLDGKTCSSCGRVFS